MKVGIRTREGDGGEESDEEKFRDAGS